MPTRVFLTGGGGFVGKAVIDELARRDYLVTALSHRKKIDPRGGKVQTADGDLFDGPALQRGMAGCEAVIHLVGIIREKPSQGVTFERIHHQATRNVVDATKASGIARYVHMSALGTRPDAVADYHKTKFLAEQYVRSSGLDWTIFRPSLIHGPGGEFMKMEAGWVRRKAPPFLFMPYFGRGLFGAGGSGRVQPVFVNDVARAFVDALERPQTIGQGYEIAGTEVLTWPQMHHAVAKAITGKSRAAVPVPVWYAMALASVPGLRSVLPFNRDQVIMSREDNVADLGKFNSDFGWEPQAFEVAVKSYAGRL